MPARTQPYLSQHTWHLKHVPIYQAICPHVTIFSPFFLVYERAYVCIAHKEITMTHPPPGPVPL